MKILCTQLLGARERRKAPTVIVGWGQDGEAAWRAPIDDGVFPASLVDARRAAVAQKFILLFIIIK